MENNDLSFGWMTPKTGDVLLIKGMSPGDVHSLAYQLQKYLPHGCMIMMVPKDLSLELIPEEQLKRYGLMRIPDGN